MTVDTNKKETEKKKKVDKKITTDPTITEKFNLPKTAKVIME